MSKQMTVAIAGLGSRGRDTYAKAAKIYPDKMKIVAIADIDPEKVKLTAEEYDVPMSHCYESAEDMLKEEKLAMVWKWIYNEKMGILNSAIRALGGKGIGWLTDPKIALYSVMIVGLWMSVGYNMIILLAGMQGISRSYYEAAQIDGAGPIQLFFKVTIPLLTPTIFFVMITSIISGFQVFDVIYMMIGKTNPAYANTQTVVMLFYRQAFDYGYKGYAAAISILIFAVIMLVTVIQMIGQKKWVNYD